MLSYLSGHSETARSAECNVTLSNVFLSLRSLRGLPGVQNVLIFAYFEQRFPIFEVTPRTARSAECIDFCMLWTMFTYLWGPSEDCRECRMYWFLHTLSNVFLSLRSLRGLSGVQNVLIFTCFEQCLPISEVTPRTAESAECIDFCILWAMFSYLWGHSEDHRECRMYWFLRALSNVYLSLRSLRRTIKNGFELELSQ